jgi:hypothetical protein
MPQYRALVDLFVMPGNIYVQAGDIVFDGPGGVLPNGWIPPAGAVDPLDPQAVQNFWTIGPGAAVTADAAMSLGPWWLGTRWSGVNIAGPKTYWTHGTDANGKTGWLLTGAGAQLGVRVST